MNETRLEFKSNDFNKIVDIVKIIAKSNDKNFSNKQILNQIKFEFIEGKKYNAIFTDGFRLVKFAFEFNEVEFYDSTPKNLYITFDAFKSKIEKAYPCSVMGLKEDDKIETYSGSNIITISNAGYREFPDISFLSPEHYKSDSITKISFSPSLMDVFIILVKDKRNFLKFDFTGNNGPIQIYDCNNQHIGCIMPVKQ